MYETWSLRLGDVVKIWIGLVVHPGVVTGFDWDGEPLVTSKTFRYGVIEQRLTDFIGGRRYRFEPNPGPLPGEVVAERALSRLGERWYPMANCEHLLAEVQGRPSSSPQLQGAVAVGILALLLFGGRGGSAA